MNTGPALGVIGPEWSSEAEAVSPVLTSGPPETRLLQIGFSTTSLSLSDQRRFPNFVRVLPTDDVQIQVWSVFVVNHRQT